MVPVPMEQAHCWVRSRVVTITRHFSVLFVSSLAHVMAGAKQAMNLEQTHQRLYVRQGSGS